MSVPVLAVCSHCHNAYVIEMVAGGRSFEAARPQSSNKSADQTVCPECPGVGCDFTISSDLIDFTSRLAVEADPRTQHAIVNVIQRNRKANFEELIDKIKVVAPQVATALHEYAAEHKHWSRPEKMTLIALFFTAVSICISIYALSHPAAGEAAPQVQPDQVQRIIIEDMSGGRLSIVVSEQRLAVRVRQTRLDMDLTENVQSTVYGFKIDL